MINEAKMAKRLLTLTIQSQKIQAEAKELKAMFAAHKGKGKHIIEGVELHIKRMNRRNIDAKKVESKLGKKAFEECVSYTTYDAVTVKKSYKKVA